MSVARATKMEKKRTDAKQKKAAVTRGKGVFDFVGDVKSEFNKITWTSSDELKVYTKIVVAATFICGMSVYFMDLGIQGILSGLGYIMRLITG